MKFEKTCFLRHIRKVEPETRDCWWDPRPRTQLIGETRDPRPETLTWDPRPETRDLGSGFPPCCCYEIFKLPTKRVITDNMYRAVKKI